MHAPKALRIATTSYGGSAGLLVPTTYTSIRLSTKNPTHIFLERKDYLVELLESAGRQAKKSVFGSP